MQSRSGVIGFVLALALGVVLGVLTVYFLLG
jgi:hypothetical protein